ncbi:hypothetical protein LWI28_023510 [Acer negundo]|uniref:UBC core domain-containing protein n=1 Tax=Acer negundo TaxID=4023 RepID=A0AAD5JDZ9_ACENE|nr:hypothetical protein LWI28_023510 [Acer negundo]
MGHHHLLRTITSKYKENSKTQWTNSFHGSSSLKFSRDGTSLQIMLEKLDNEKEKKIEPKIIGDNKKNLDLFHKVLGRLELCIGLEQNSRIKKGNFENFDVVEDYSDNHYAKRKSKNCFTNTGSYVYKAIMRDRKILSNDLPESIFVRVYEKMIDLLKAVIIGAQGTPYHDIPPFFDIAFPYNYPVKPPQVFYMSYGPRLNPNLTQLIIHF